MKKWGKLIKIELEGASHSDRIEFTLDGIKKGEDIDLAYVDHMLQRRSAFAKDYATARKEKDQLFITDGLKDGKTTGSPIRGYFLNEDRKSKDYSSFSIRPRPSHIDYLAMMKYGEDFDLSGSSIFSGRLTVALVAMGAMAKQILEKRGIYIGSHFKKLYNLEDKPMDPVNLSVEDLKSLDKNLPFIDQSLETKLFEMLEEFKNEKDSFGGIIELGIVGNLNYLGGPYFDRLQSSLSNFLLSIPGTKGIEFGNGFKASQLKGVENNDPWTLIDSKVTTKSNNAGGIIGGIASGAPIIFRTSIKPTASIGKIQKSLDLESGREEEFSIEGRHDPAFVLRISPVIESMASLVLLDLVYEMEAKSLRDKIDIIDRKLVDLYIERMSLTDQVGLKKLDSGRPVEDSVREGEILQAIKFKYPQYSEELERLYTEVFATSKKRQENIIRIGKASYGLLGKKLSYSYSKEIHEAFADYVYEILELRPEELGDFLSRKGLKGLNVTIPYKTAVIPYLDELTREAELIGVVNTIKFDQGRKIGFNTDFYGFKKLLVLKRVFVKDEKVIVLGTGATSKTVEAVLKNMKAKEVVFVSRTGDLNYENIYDLEGFKILINTTPVGTEGFSDELLLDLDRIKGLEYVIDVVYNPLYSRLVLEAKKRGIKAFGGLDMLIYQAKKSVEIFTGDKILDWQAREVRDKIFAKKCNIVLVGMPGSGKTTIGRNLSKKLDKNHVDLDEEFFRMHGIRPASAMADFGELEFRRMESQVAKKFGAMKNLIISTGGGVVTREENYFHLKQNAMIFMVDRDVRKLSTRNRPLSQGGIKTLYKLKEAREESYEMFADYVVINNGYFKYAVEDIAKLYLEMLREM